ncbi:MAG: hypothetical protein P4L51_23740 [Puia sp.]|nr:hypothetical protein [Puia sp.]
MTTNFFTLLETLAFYGNTTLQLSLSKETGWTGYIHFTDPNAGESFNNKLIPLTFQGTSAYLNEHFISTLREPVRQVQEGFANRTAFAASLKAAEASSKSSPAKPVPKSSVPALPARYVESMKKVDELASKKLYGQAIGALPSKEKFPGQATAIDKRLAELRTLHGGLSLFPGEPPPNSEASVSAEPVTTEDPVGSSNDESDDDPADNDPNWEPGEDDDPLDSAATEDDD